MTNAGIIIIGAGAAGLMAARELSQKGKKVIVLEARDRIGGRIMPLNEARFGYPAQGGAEFVHGQAKITKELLKEAGLTFVPHEGERWSTRSGELMSHVSFLSWDDEAGNKLKESLADLKGDMSITAFLKEYFDDEKHAGFRNSIVKIVEGYDAADPDDISTFTVRDEWLGKARWKDGKIKEGYGALISFLEKQCVINGTKIYLNSVVTTVDFTKDKVTVITSTGEKFQGEDVVVTVPLPVIKNIDFTPAIPEKLEAVSNIGFGNVIKLAINFKTQWWDSILGKDMSKMSFFLTNEPFLTWWTQYPYTKAAMIGWMAGPTAEKSKHLSPEELLDIAVSSLAHAFKIDKEIIEKEISVWQIVNWPADPFTQGAYSYTKVVTKDAYEIVAEPIDDTVYFAGEALYETGDSTATVEGALGSGREVAKKILKNNMPARVIIDGKE